MVLEKLFSYLVILREMELYLPPYLALEWVAPPSLKFHLNGLRKDIFLSLKLVILPFYSVLDWVKPFLKITSQLLDGLMKDIILIPGQS